MAVVKRFVREVLGCNCPDEVFKRVQVKLGSSAITTCSADYEINVGGKLLIVLTSEPVDDFSPDRLETVMAEGRSARDAGKFNRFRFIVRADNSPEAEEKSSRLSERRVTKDARTHLHVIGKEEVPDFFAGSGERT